MEIRRLHPEPAALPLAEVIGALEPAALSLNMVASVDGRAAYQGRTRQLGGELDRALFHGLRERVDCVLVGAGTARAERYGPMIKSDEARARRVAAGLAPEPVAAVASRSGDVPLDGAVIGDDPLELLARLREERGVRTVLCEGGPELNAALLQAGVVDELFLTLSPQLLGGRHPLTIVGGDGPREPVPLELLWLLEGDGDLFTRWRLMR